MSQFSPPALEPTMLIYNLASRENLWSQPVELARYLRYISGGNVKKTYHPEYSEILLRLKGLGVVPEEILADLFDRYVELGGAFSELEEQAPNEVDT